MAYRSKPYKIQLNGAAQACRVSAVRFQQCLRDGLILLVAGSTRVARVQSGVKVWIDGEMLCIYDPKAGVGVSIPSSWRLVDQAAKYDHRWIKDDLTRSRYVQDEEVKVRVLERRRDTIKACDLSAQ